MAIIKRFQRFSPIQSQPVRYADITTAFKIHPNKLDLILDENTEAVKSSIKNILLTNRGERFFNTFLGANLSSHLFENFDTTTKNSIRSAVTSSISNFEPRAKVESVDVDYLIDENAIQITITFTTINNTAPVVLEMFLNRAR